MSQVSTMDAAIAEANKIQDLYYGRGFPLQEAIMHNQTLALIAIADALGQIARSLDGDGG